MRRTMWALAVCGVVGLTYGVGSAQDRYPESRESSFGRSPFSASAFKRKFSYFSRNPKSDKPADAGDQTESAAAKPQDVSAQTKPFFGTRVRSLAQAPNRYARNRQPIAAPPVSIPADSQAVPKFKNYHQELFGTTARTPSSKPVSRVTAVPQAAERLPQPRETISGGSPIQRAEFSSQSEPVQTTKPLRLPSMQRLQTYDLPTESQTGFENNPFETQKSYKAIQADYDRPAGSSERGKILPVRSTRKILSPFKSPEQIALERKNAALKKDQQTSVRKPTLAAPKLTLPKSETAKPQPIVKVAPESGIGRQSIAVPNFSQNTPTITLKWAQRSSFNVGQKCVCDLLVTNTSQVDATNVEVEAYFPSSIRLTSASPEPSEARDHLVWHFAALAPGEQQTIEISMIPSQRGEIANTATVRFTGASSRSFEVQEPMLKLAVKGPKQVRVGESASQVVTISNPGSGVAHNVVLEVQVPQGLEHIRGERLYMQIGSLNPRESRDVRLSLAAIGGGQHTIHVEVKADAALSQLATAEVDVVAPSLNVTIDGPGLRYLGRNATYSVTVSNDGTVATNNVRVTHIVPAGFKFVSSGKGGKYDPATKGITWFVGRLSAQQSTALNVRLAAKELGEYVHYVRAISEHGAQATAQSTTTIEGTASLILEIVELDDPVEVGHETAYEIRVANKGTKAAGNVGITCEVPDGVKLVAAKGATSHVVKNGSVVFKKLRSLAPGKTALFKVIVRGEKEGNHRFRARLTSDSITDPLTFEELTKFYAD